MFSRNLPPFTPPRTPEEDRAVLLESLAALGEHAAHEGVSVFLEPLNRYEDHMLHTLAEAVALCEALALPSVKVMADFFHMNIEEDDIGRAIRATGPHLAPATPTFALALTRCGRLGSQALWRWSAGCAASRRRRWRRRGAFYEAAWKGDRVPGAGCGK
jgi:hypothetical protein